MDPWYSLGKADMLDVAFMGLHVGQLSSREDMAWCFDAITSNSATVLHLEDYGISVGSKANFNLLQAKDTIEAIRLRAHRLSVVRSGKLIATNVPLKAELLIEGRPNIIDPSTYAPE